MIEYQQEEHTPTRLDAFSAQEPELRSNAGVSRTDNVQGHVYVLRSPQTPGSAECVRGLCGASPDLSRSAGCAYYSSTRVAHRTRLTFA